MSEKKEQPNNETGGGEDLSEQGQPDRISGSGRGAAEVDAASEMSPEEQWQTADDGSGALGEDVAGGVCPRQFAFQVKREGNHGVDVGAADFANVGNGNERTSGAEKKTSDRTAQSGVRQPMHHGTSRSKIQNHKRQAEGKQQGGANEFSEKILPGEFQTG